MEHENALFLIPAAVALTLASAAHAQQVTPATPAAPKTAGAAVAPAPATLAYGNPASAPQSTKTEVTSCKPSMPNSCADATTLTRPKTIHHISPKPRASTVFLAPMNMGTESSAEAKRWQEGGSARPVMGPDGLLQYPFGQAQPELTCAPLRACDIQLQAGEVINNVILGDTVRWIPAPAKTGDGALATPHVIVKPTEAGLQTNLIITTNRRTYTLTLRSSEVSYVSRVGFYYPADMVQDWNGAAESAQRKADEDAKRKVSDMPIASIEQLNLDGYKVKGDRSLAWYPIRVFDDGTHVWIQMPASMKSNEAPALVLLDKRGESELVNYRVKEADQGGTKVTYYIVDKLFERAGLIVGVGRDQRKVEIIKDARTVGNSSNWTRHSDN